jgi:DNA polymerase-4
MVARTVVLKVRFADFTTITRSRTLRQPTDLARDVHAAAVAAFDGLGLDRARIRLVGVKAEGLQPLETAPMQLVLGAPEHGWRDAERAVDDLSRRFGAGVVRPGTLVDRRSAERGAEPGHR